MKKIRKYFSLLLVSIILLGGIITISPQQIASQISKIMGGAIAYVGDCCFWLFGYNFASLDLAASAAPNRTLWITTPINLTQNTVIPSTCNLKISREGSIVQTGAFTLTINGPFEAGPYQVFSGFSGNDIIWGLGSVKEVYAEWWGAKGDVTADPVWTAVPLLPNPGTDDTVPLRAALLSLDGSTGVKILKLLENKWYRSNTLTLPRFVTIQGGSPNRTTMIWNNFQTSGIVIPSTGSYTKFNTIKDLSILAYDSIPSPSGAKGIDIQANAGIGGTSYVTVDNVYIRSFYNNFYSDRTTNGDFSNISGAFSENDDFTILGSTTSTPGDCRYDHCLSTHAGRDGWNISTGNLGWIIFEACGGNISARHGWNIVGDITNTYQISNLIFTGCGFETAAQEQWHIEGVYNSQFIEMSGGNNSGLSYHFVNLYNITRCTFIGASFSWGIPAAGYGINYRPLQYGGNSFIGCNFLPYFIVDPTTGMRNTKFINTKAKNPIEPIGYFYIPGDGDIIDQYQYYTGVGTQPVTSGTDWTTLKSYSMAGGFIPWDGGVEIEVSGAISGTAGQKDIILYFGDTNVTFWQNTANAGQWRAKFIIKGATSTPDYDIQSLDAEFIMHGVLPVLQIAEYTADLRSDFYIRISGKCANAGDSITLKHWTVRMIGSKLGK